MVGMMDHLGQRRTGRFDGRMLRDVERSEAGKIRARQVLRRMTSTLQREVANFQGSTPAEYAAYAADLEADYIEATRLYNEFMNVNPNDPVLTDVDKYIREVRRHLRTILKNADRAVRQQVGLNHEFRNFVEQADKAARQRSRVRPARAPRTGGGGASNPANFPHVPTGGSTAQRQSSRALISRMSRTAGRGALGTANLAAYTLLNGQLGMFPGLGRGGGSSRPGNATAAESRGPAISQMTAFERTTLQMNRQVMKRDQEFQEWQQDFWTKFARNFGRGAAQPEKKGMSLTDLLAAALGLKGLGKWAMRRLGNIGDLVKGFGRGLRRLVGKALGLGAILNMDEVTKFLNDFNTKFSTRWSNFVDGINAKLEGMRTGLGTRFEAIKTQFTKSIQGLSDAITTRVGDMGRSTLSAFDEFSRVVGDGVNRVTSTVVDAVDALGNRITTSISGIRDGVVRVVDEAGAVVSTKITELKDGMVSVLDDAGRAVTASADALRSGFSNALDAVATAIDQFGPEFNARLETARTSMTDGLENMRVSVVDSVGRLTSSVGSAFEATLTTISDFASRADTVLDDWTAKVGGAMDATNAKITELANDLGRAFDAAGTLISDSATKVVDNMGRASTAVMDFASEVGKAGSAVGDFVDNQISRLSDLPAKLQTFLQPTLDTLEGWANRLGDIIGEIPGKIEGAFATASDLASRAGSALWDGAKTVGNGLAAAGSAVVNNPVARAVGNAVGKTAKAAGIAGDAVGAVMGPVNFNENYGKLDPLPATDMTRLVGGAAGGIASSGIADVTGLVTGNEFRPGTEERAMVRAYENAKDMVTGGDDALRAETLAAALVRGDRVPASDLGTDTDFLEMVVRRVNDVVDHNRKNLTRDNWLTGNASLNPAVTPKEFDFLQSPLGTEFLLNDSEGFAAFVKANNYAAAESEAALRRYYEAVKNGKVAPNQTVRRMHGDMRALTAAIEKEFKEYVPQSDPRLDALDPSTTNSVPAEQADMSPNFSNAMGFGVGGIINQPIVAQPLGQPLTGRDGGQTITIAETSPEAVFPLVRDPVSGDLGVNTHTIAPKGPVALKTEEFGVTFAGDSARQFAFALIEAIKRYIDPDAFNESGEGKGEDSAGEPEGVNRTVEGDQSVPGSAVVKDAKGNPVVPAKRNPNFIDHEARDKEDTVLNNEIAAADAEVARLESRIQDGRLTGSMEEKAVSALAAARSRRAELGKRQQRVTERRAAEDRVATAAKTGGPVTTNIADLGVLPGVDNPAARAAHIADLERRVATAPNDEVRRRTQAELDVARSVQKNSATVSPEKTAERLAASSALTDDRGRIISTADTSLPPEQRAFLDTLAMGDATSGKNYWESPDYNTIVGKGGKFDSYADHPRVFGTKTSTAAGRYQFTKTTWDDTVKRYNRANPDNPITDFSPKNQDRAALFLAQGDYARRTGGRDLMADLKSGDPRLGDFISAGLGGSGNNTTWEILQKKSGGQIQSAFDANLERNKGYGDGTGAATAVDANAATVGDMQKIEANLSTMVDNPLVGIPREQIDVMRGQRDALRTRIADVQAAEKKATADAPAAAPGAGGGSNPATLGGTAGGKSLRIAMDEAKWAGVDPRMRAIAEEMSLRSEHGIEVFSGKRNSGSPNHDGGFAFDFNVLDKDGKAIPQPYLSKGGRGSFPGATENFRTYEKAAQLGRLIQLKKFPELTDRFRTGSYFGGVMGKQYGANDSMHLDITPGARGAMGAGSWEKGLTDVADNPRTKRNESFKYRGYFDRGSDPSQGLGTLEEQMAMAERLDELYPIAAEPQVGPTIANAERQAEIDKQAEVEAQSDLRSSPFFKSRFASETDATTTAATTAGYTFKNGVAVKEDGTALLENGKPVFDPSTEFGRMAAAEMSGWGQPRVAYADTGGGAAVANYPGADQPWARGRQRVGNEGSRFGNRQNADGSFTNADIIQGGDFGGGSPFGRGFGGRGGGLLSTLLGAIQPGPNGGVRIGANIGGIDMRADIGGVLGENIKGFANIGAIAKGIADGSISPEQVPGILKNMNAQGQLPPGVSDIVTQAEQAVNRVGEGLTSAMGLADKNKISSRAAPDSDTEGGETEGKGSPIHPSEAERAEAVAEPEPATGVDPMTTRSVAPSSVSQIEDTDGASRPVYQPTPKSVPVPQPKPEQKQAAAVTTGRPAGETQFAGNLKENRIMDPEQVALLSNGLRTV